MRTPWTRALIVLGLCLTLAPVAPAEDAPSPWADAELLATHLERACDMVEAICGAKFARRPGVRVSDADTLAKLLLTDLDLFPEEVLAKADRRGFAKLLAPFLLAKYDTAGHVIHVLPEAVKSVETMPQEDAPLGVDHLRLLLVHEATHALDFTRFDWISERRARKTADEHKALNAVVEGHAQWVAEQAAGRWKLEGAFERLTGAILGKTKEPPGQPGPPDLIAAALLAEMRFAYAEGHTFFRAVAAARGASGVEAVLRAPPRRTRLIERPQTYLEPEPEPAVDLAVLVDAFRPVVAHEAWTVKTQRVLEVVLRSQISRVPADRREDFLRGFADAHMLVGTVPGEDLQIVALVALFDTPEHARLFVALERAIVESAKDNPPVLTIETKALGDGAGTGGRQQGFHMHRVVKIGTKEVAVVQQVFAVGHVACELMAINVPGVDRAAMDPVVDYAAALIADPDGGAALEKPAPLPFTPTKRIVTAHVLDAEGKAVPDATLVSRTGEDGRFQFETTHCVEGTCKLVLDLKPATVMALRAHDAKGEPLNLAPSASVEVPTDVASIELRMPQGLTIQGRVLSDTGAPVAGARIEARPGPAGREDFLSAGGHGAAHAADDGTFEIVGLARTAYRLVVTTEEGPFAFEHPFPDQAAGSRDVELELQKLDSVQVTVVDPEGQPVFGAFVRASPHRTGGFPSSATDKDGVARLRGVDREAAYDLEVEVEYLRDRDDLASYRQRDWKPADTRVKLAAGWTLRGVVLDKNGEPQGARVFRKIEGGWSSRTTQEDGSFALRGLDGPVEVAARPRGAEHDHLLLETIEWTKFEPSEERVELRMVEIDRSKLLRVRILDGDGRPVPRAKLRVGTGPEDSPFSTSTASDVAGGAHTLERPRQRYAITAYAARGRDGTALALGPVLRTDVDPAQESIDLTLPEGRRLSGTVTNAQGEPVGGVEVLALPGPGEATERGPWNAHAVATTQPDGTFELVSLGEGPYSLRAIPPQPHVDVEPEPVRVEATATSVVVRLARAITLRVVDWQERPVEGARVYVTRVTRHGPDEQSYMRPFEGRTDAEGTVRMHPLRADLEHNLDIEPPKGRADLLPTRIADWDKQPGAFTLRRGYVITGVVRDAQGPLAGVAVQGRSALDKDEAAWGWVAKTDERGRFATLPVPYGSFRLRAQRDSDDWNADPHRSPVVEATPQGAEISLTLEPHEASLSLRVEGAQQGWSGWVVREGGGRVAFEFEADGATTVRGLAAGAWSVYVPDPDDPGRCAYATGLATSGGVRTLELQTTRTIRFRVAVPEDAQDLSVFVQGPAFERFEATQGADGVYVAQGLPAGTWKAMAYAKVANVWQQGVTPTDGAQVVMVTLKPLQDE